MDRVSLNLLVILSYIYFKLFYTICHFHFELSRFLNFKGMIIFCICTLIFKSLWMILGNFDNATTWSLYVQFYDNTCIMSLYDDIKWFICWWDITRTRWWLRSTADFYGRLVLDVAYGKMIIHSTEVVWEILAREEWLGCRHDTSLMDDILESNQCGQSI